MWLCIVSVGCLSFSLKNSPQETEGLAEADDPEDTEGKEYILTLPDGVPSRFRYYLDDARALFANMCRTCGQCICQAAFDFGDDGGFPRCVSRVPNLAECEEATNSLYFNLMFKFSGDLVSYTSVLANSSKPGCIFLCSSGLDEIV